MSLDRSLVGGFERFDRLYGPWTPGRGQYICPIDESEQNRLDLFHQLFLVAFDGEITSYPYNLEVPHRVLDLGAGTGIWAIQAASRFPRGTQIMTVDLHPLHPPDVPSCVTPVQWDIELDSWDPVPNEFDLVHIRMVFESIRVSRRPQVYRNIFTRLTPGRGTLEHLEVEWIPSWDNNYSPPNSALREWSAIYLEAMSRFERDARIVPNNVVRLLESIGFTNVIGRSMKCYLNPWSRNERDRDVGKWFNLGFCQGIDAMSLLPMVETMGMTQEQVIELCDRVRDELRDLSYHPSFKVWIWTARRPHEQNVMEN